jgi:hypothetical protein
LDRGGDATRQNTATTNHNSIRISSGDEIIVINFIIVAAAE